MIKKYNIKKLLPYFSEKIGSAVGKISPIDSEMINEIRLRGGRAVGISTAHGEYFLSTGGGLTQNTGLAVTAEMSDIEHSFSAVCDYSVHSYKRELSEGFITLEGGNRVGICGTAVMEGEGISALKYISGLNFRISGQAQGSADELFRRCFGRGASSALIIGPPSSGKTTLLRDLCRTLGGRYKLSVVDERGEIGAVYHGVPQNDVGVMTDILDGYPKAAGIETAVRVMSPQIVVCDEIGGRADCEAIMESSVCGVKLIASAHGFSHESVLKHEWLGRLIRTGIFDHIAVLEGAGSPGKIKYIMDTEEILC